MADFTQTVIEASALHAEISNILHKNVSISLATQPVAMTKMGHAAGVVNTDYEGDANAPSYTVGITRTPRFNTVSRDMDGVSVNGGFANTNAKKQLTNNTIALVLDKVYDERFGITINQDSTVNFSVVNRISKLIANEITESIDTTTLKEMYDASIAYDAAIVTDRVIKLANASGAAVADADIEPTFDAIFEAQTDLALNAENVYDITTDKNGRSVVCVEKFYTAVRRQIVVVAGSEGAYITRVIGTESLSQPGGLAEVQAQSYRGMYKGYSVFTVLSRFMPVPVAGEVLAMFTHPDATTRAMATDKQRIVPDPDVYGDVLQYNIRWGILTHKPWMVFVVGTSDFSLV